MISAGPELATTKAAADEASTAPRVKPRFGYCAECGTWDAHETACACCGFDFRAPATKLREAAG